MSTDKIVVFPVGGMFPAGDPKTRLQGNVPVLLQRVLVSLVLEVLERGNELSACFPRPDDLVDEAAAGRDIRVRELLAELLHFFGSNRRAIGCDVQLALVQNVDR